MFWEEKGLGAGGALGAPGRERMVWRNSNGGSGSGRHRRERPGQAPERGEQRSERLGTSPASNGARRGAGTKLKRAQGETPRRRERSGPAGRKR